MFGVEFFGLSPFGSLSPYDSPPVVASPPSPCVIVGAAAALNSKAALVNNGVVATLSNTRLKIKPTLLKTDFT